MATLHGNVAMIRATVASGRLTDGGRNLGTFSQGFAMFVFFVALWVLTLIQVVLGGYLYVAKIVPSLQQKHGRLEWAFWPHELFAHIDEYLSLLDRERSRPWFYLFLKTERWVIVFLWLAFAVWMLSAWMTGPRAF